MGAGPITVPARGLIVVEAALTPAAPEAVPDAIDRVLWPGCAPPAKPRAVDNYQRNITDAVIGYNAA